MSWWRTSRRFRPFWAGPRRCWRTTAMPTATRSRRLPRATLRLWWRPGRRNGRRRRYDFRPAKTEVPVKKPKAEWLKVMAAKLDSEEGRQTLYRLRQQTVEPVFGIIKAALGFTGFSLRGARQGGRGVGPGGAGLQLQAPAQARAVRLRSCRCAMVGARAGAAKARPAQHRLERSRTSHRSIRDPSSRIRRNFRNAWFRRQTTANLLWRDSNRKSDPKVRHTASPDIS